MLQRFRVKWKKWALSKSIKMTRLTLLVLLSLELIGRSVSNMMEEEPDSVNFLAEFYHFSIVFNLGLPTLKVS